MVYFSGSYCTYHVHHSGDVMHLVKGGKVSFSSSHSWGLSQFKKKTERLVFNILIQINIKLFISLSIILSCNNNKVGVTKATLNKNNSLCVFTEAVHETTCY